MDKKRKREDDGDEGSYGKDVDEKHESESSSEEDSLASAGKDDDFVGVGGGGVGGGRGVGGGGGKTGKGKGKKGSNKSNVSSASTKKFTKEDDEWAKDLPPGFTDNHKDWYDALSDAIHQGHLKVCWAVAIAKCIQALYAIKNVRVELSPQHLINNIAGKSKKTGHIRKYKELSNLLLNHGLVLEEACKFTGKIGETCSKECTCQTSEESFYKIKEFNYIKQKDLKEEDVLEIVKLRPIVAIIDDYESFHKHRTGIYKGHLKRKDKNWGLHAVLVYGFGTTEEGEHYWLVQNSWGKEWGKRGLGKIIRKCSRNDGESSLFVGVIHMTV